MKSVDNMMAFNPIQKTEWLARIQKDLKGKSLEEFEWKLAPDLQFDPFIHSSDLSDTDTNFLRLNRVSNQLPLAFISESEPIPANKHALDQLQQGAGSILFEAQVEEPEDLYKDISVEMIAVYHKHLVLSVNQTPDQFSEWRDEMVAACKSIMAASEMPKSLVLKLGTNLFLNVCSIRATRIVFQQLARDLNFNIDAFKITSVYDLDQTKDLEENLQRSMPKVFSAYIAGADHIGPLQRHHNEEGKWYHNLVHLLVHESDIPMNEDTVTGAFLFESLTNKIADSIWNHLINIDEK